VDSEVLLHCALPILEQTNPGQASAHVKRSNSSKVGPSGGALSASKKFCSSGKLLLGVCAALDGAPASLLASAVAPILVQTTPGQASVHVKRSNRSNALLPKNHIMAICHRQGSDGFRWVKYSHRGRAKGTQVGAVSCLGSSPSLWDCGTGLVKW